MAKNTYRETDKSAFAPYPWMAFFRDMAKTIKPYKWQFWIVTISRIIADICKLIFVYVFSRIISDISSNPQAFITTKNLVLYSFLLMVPYVLRSIGIWVSRYFGFALSERANIDTQKKIFFHMYRLDLAWHEKENSGNKMKRAENAGEGYRTIIVNWFQIIIESITTFAGGIVVFWKFDWRVSLLTSFFIVIYYVLARYYRIKGVRAAAKVHIQEEIVEGSTFEIINNIRTVKSLGILSKFRNTINQSFEKLYELIKVRIHFFQKSNLVTALFTRIFYSIMLIFIAVGVAHGLYTVGFLVLFFTYFDYIWESVSQLAGVTQDIFIAKNAIARGNTILDTPVVIEDERGKGAFPHEWKKIILENVSFSYEDNKVLQDVSFTVKKGEKIGIVGLSGAGKSTLFKLLLKEYEHFTGKIGFNDTPIETIRKNDYLAHVATVLQDTEVFNLSLKDNIVIAGSTDRVNDEHLARAITIAHLDDVIAKLPHGVDTLIGEKGVKLSGGERQRLGIARAVYKQPEILLLDEATSHLDLESEEKIRDSLHQFFSGITAIVIAHRLTTIKEMDRIIVIEGGQIIEEGSFAKLIRKKGRFYELWNKQAL